MRTRGSRSCRTAALLLLLAVLALFCGNATPVGAATDAETAPLAKPTGLTVSTQPGSLEVSLDWDDVAGADGYRVRWRSVDKGEKLNEGVEVEASEADISLDDYGEWVVRVQACAGDACGPPLAKKFTVEPSQPTVPDPEPANRAPEVDAKAARYDSFTETGNAPRGTLVHRNFEGIFSDPDGDALTFTAAVTAGRAGLVDTVHVDADRSLLFVQVDGDDDWAALSPVPANPLVTTVTLTATDPDGLSASLSAIWHTAWDAPDPEPVSDPEDEPAKALTDNSDLLGVSVTASALEILVGEPVTLSANRVSPSASPTPLPQQPLAAPALLPSITLLVASRSRGFGRWPS